MNINCKYLVKKKTFYWYKNPKNKLQQIILKTLLKIISTT